MILFNEILLQPKDVEMFFVKLLTKNDDSGKHGIVVPIEVYKMLPINPNPISGNHIDIPCIYTIGGKNGVKKRVTLHYKHYHQKSHSKTQKGG